MKYVDFWKTEYINNIACIYMLLVKYKSIFDTALYTKNNKDLQHITDKDELWHHAMDYGVYEGRRIFNDLQTDLAFYNAVTLHRYSNLDLDFYRLANADLRNLPDYELCRHYHDFGRHEGRLTRLERNHKMDLTTSDTIALKASLYWINTSDRELAEGILFHGIDHTTGSQPKKHCYLIHIYNIHRLETILSTIDLSQDIIINFELVNLLKYDFAEILERYMIFDRSVIIRTQYNVGIDILPQLCSHRYLRKLGLEYQYYTLIHSKTDERLLKSSLVYLKSKLDELHLQSTLSTSSTSKLSSTFSSSSPSKSSSSSSSKSSSSTNSPIAFGILCPPEILVTDTLGGPKHISNKYYLLLLSNLYGITIKDDTSISFCGGTLLILNSKVLDLLVSKLTEISKYFNTAYTVDYNWKICTGERGLQYNNNIDCRNQGIDLLPDGMFEHSVERFLGIITAHLGLSISS